MKKRILSMILVCVLVLGAVPASAGAASAEDVIGSELKQSRSVYSGSMSRSSAGDNEDVFEYEPNNHPLEPNIGYEGTGTYGKLTYGDIDFYRFNVAHRGEMDLLFVSLSSSAVAGICTYNKSTDKIDFIEFSRFDHVDGEAYCSTLSVTLDAGNYFVVIADPDDGVGDYGFLYYLFTEHVGNFQDVPVDRFFSEPVRWAVQNGITDGITPTSFGPERACTRGQAVTFIWRAMGCPQPASTYNPFTDVDMNTSYGTAVLWAVERGITSGMTPTTFQPGRACTRGHIVTFLSRLENIPHVNKSYFTDVPANAFYADAVNWAVQKGITSGMTATTFQPERTCSRGHIVTFLYRYLCDSNVSTSGDLVLY